jgi:hypothetical protein
MLGRTDSRGYCLEMICADFLAGANIENGSSKPLLLALSRLFSLLPQPEKGRRRNSWQKYATRREISST